MENCGEIWDATQAEIAGAQAAWLQEVQKDLPDPDKKFRLGWMLCRSAQRNEVRQGLCLLADMIDEGFSPRDCLYYIAIAHFRLGEYRLARYSAERLLKADATSVQAHELHRMITERVNNHGVAGLWIIVCTAALCTTLLLQRYRNK